MSKDIYTFGEVVFGLREEYLKTQKLLDELKNHIRINGIDQDEEFFRLDKGIRGNNIIRLDIEKKQNDLIKAADFITNGLFSRNEPYQVVKKGEDGYYFSIDDYKTLNPDVHYSINFFVT